MDLQLLEKTEILILWGPPTPPVKSVGHEKLALDFLLKKLYGASPATKIAESSTPSFF